MSRATQSPAPIKITINLRIQQNGEVKEELTYSSGSARDRKTGLRQKIRDEKEVRGKTFNLPHGDHSEHEDHDSWIPFPGDTVVWSCDREFFLYVDQDLGVCNSVKGAPRHPFDEAAFNVVQRAQQTSNGRFELTGTATRNELSNRQMFYKYTAWVVGSLPLDPDGICPVGP